MSSKRSDGNPIRFRFSKDVDRRCAELGPRARHPPSRGSSWARGCWRHGPLVPVTWRLGPDGALCPTEYDPYIHHIFVRHQTPLLMSQCSAISKGRKMRHAGFLAFFLDYPKPQFLNDRLPCGGQNFDPITPPSIICPTLRLSRPLGGSYIWCATQITKTPHKNI